MLHESYVSGNIFHSLNTTPTVNEKGEKDILLMLQKIMGGRGHKSREPINVLWDVGSTLSFVTFKAAKRLNL